MVATMREGDVSADWRYHDDQHVDFALGRLPSGTKVKNWIEPRPADLSEIRDELICLGYIKDGGGIQRWHDRFSGHNNDLGWVALQNGTLPGVSGGAVIHDGAAVAVVLATRRTGEQKFVLPIRNVYSWMQQQGVVPAPSPDGKSDRLLRVPIGPKVYPADFPDCVVTHFADTFPDRPAALAHLARTTALAVVHDAEKFGRRAVAVNPGDLPAAGPIREFWQAALWQAGNRSRRSLAAFFDAAEAPNPALLDEPERQAFVTFRSWLEKPNGID